MFKAATYIERRKLLRKSVGSGLLIFLANEESPMNYTANTFHYRQDSSFLYFFGLSSPGLAAIIDADENNDTLYGDDIGIEDIIWMGELPTIKDRALEVGVRRTAPRAAFDETVRKALGRRPARPLSSAVPARQRHRLERASRHPRQGPQGQGLGRASSRPQSTSASSNPKRRSGRSSPR